MLDEQLQRVVDTITKSVVPEKIFLLGAIYTQQHHETIFTEPETKPVVKRAAQYYLLLLAAAGSKVDLDELQNIAESCCSINATPVCIYRETIQTFNSWLQAGHPFACYVQQHGRLLYDAATTALAAPAPLVPGNTKQEFSYWNNRISEFLAGADYFRLRKEFTLGTFFLHQAAEQALTILIKIMTGYRVVSHNLDKLFQYARLFSTEIGLLFNRQITNEQQLFKLLQHSYINSRYSNEYNIKESELCLLMERVKQLHQIVQKIVAGKIAG